MNAILELLQGKKTYVTGLVVAGLLIGQWRGLWKMPDELYLGSIAAMLVFIRSGAKKDSKKISKKMDSVALATGATLPPPDEARPGGTRLPMIGLLAVAAVAAAIVAGCASFNTTVFRAEKLAATTARGSVHIWNQYYPLATNGAPAAEIVSLKKAQEEIYAASRRLGATLQVVDALREEYAANPATTNRTTLSAALSALQSQSGEVAAIIKSYMSH